jgi:hypothetical protein
MYGKNRQNSARSRLGLPLGKELILLLNRHGAMSATTPLLFRGIGSIANTASVTKDCSTARSENICRLISVKANGTQNHGYRRAILGNSGSLIAQLLGSLYFFGTNTSLSRHDPPP